MARLALVMQKNPALAKYMRERKLLHLKLKLKNHDNEEQISPSTGDKNIEFQ